MSLNYKDFLNEVVKPLQNKIEPVYVLPDSDAEDHVKKRFTDKHVRRVRSGSRPRIPIGAKPSAQPL